MIFFSSSPSLAGGKEESFVNLALRNVEFSISGKVEKLLVDGRVTNGQVLKGCEIENVVPISHLVIRRPGRFLIQLKVKCKNSFLTRTLNVKFNVDAEVWGFETTDVVERGEYLAGKVKRKKFLLSTVRGELFDGNPEKVVAKTRLPAGTPVLKRFVEVPFAVKRGQLVKIVAEKGGIYVETTGKALQNGRVGDIIKVKNIYSGKVIEGRVKDEETVVILVF